MSESNENMGMDSGAGYGGHSDDLIHFYMDLPEDRQVPRWRAFNFILAIPHYIYIAVLMVVSLIMGFIVFLSVLFGGTYPAFVHRFYARFATYLIRVRMYVWMLTQDYPKISI